MVSMRGKVRPEHFPNAKRKDRIALMPDLRGPAQDRMNFVVEQVQRLLTLSARGPAKHFYCYPPREFLDLDGGMGTTTNIHEKLKDTVWWIRWSNGEFVQLQFMELLIFVHQFIAMRASLNRTRNAAQTEVAHQKSKHSGGWQPKKDRKHLRKTVNVNVEVATQFTPLELVKDEMIRALLSTFTIEKEPKPTVAMN
jgi:hypothetical protein